MLRNLQRYFATRVRKFHRIGQTVQKHLLKSQTVTEYLRSRHSTHIHRKIQLMGLHIQLQDILKFFYDIEQIGFLFAKVQPSTFNTAHIQHIIDQRQQVIASRGYLI